MPILRCRLARRSLLAAVLASTLGGMPAHGQERGSAIPTLAGGAPIAAAEHAQRRAAIAAQMEDGVLVVLGADEPESDYLPYAQSPAFRYLTGITEPGAALVIAKAGVTVREHLFVLPKDPSREVWEGARLGNDRAKALTGIETRSREAFHTLVDSLLPRNKTLYSISPLSSDGSRSEVLRADQQIVARIAARHPGTRVVSLDDALFRIRAKKSAAELDLIRRAVLITLLAHRNAMQAVEPGMNEFEVQALIEATFRRNGAERPSFASIVGSGPNSTTLHYRAADRFMEAGEMLVMDIGASYRGYAADVTRSIPVSGRFSPRQREIYEIVLAAQKAAEAQARPGASLSTLTQTAARVVAEGLARIGLIESADATYDCRAQGEMSRCPQWRLFFMHGLSHGIGLDVHDPELAYYGTFDVGSAFTIEPGVYVRSDVLDFLENTPTNQALIRRIRPKVEIYRNIGVRIEDDYFITPGGVERVSTGAPREIAEIEALMAQQHPWNRDRRPDVVEWYRTTTPR